MNETLIIIREQLEMGYKLSFIEAEILKKVIDIQLGNYPVVPDGWKMVPIEPTEAMLLVLGMTGSFDFMIEKYRNMLAAAPQHKGE